MNQYINMSTREERGLTARQAAERLGVSPATLYAYVSRGKLRSFPGEGRARWYAAEDVERAKAAAQARTGHGPVAGAALLWGEPVLSTELVELTERGPRYRGLDALELAESGVGFESVAELLWRSEPAVERVRWQEALRRPLLLKGVPRAKSPLGLMSLVLPALALGDPGRFLLSERSDLSRARRLIRSLVEYSSLGRPRTVRRVQKASSVAEALLLALGGRVDEEAVAAVDRALILVLDHELNASTFAARVAASTGADLYACLTAGLATLSGPRHGGATDRVEALLEEVASPRRASGAVVARRRRGELIPGFGHPLYPAGDPRAVPLLQYAERSERVEVRTLRAIRRAMQRAGQPPPTIDFALVSLAQALGLVKGSAALLFFVGRSAGWVAHVLEQRRQGGLLRPRAAYVGRAVAEGTREGLARAD